MIGFLRETPMRVRRVMLVCVSLLLGFGVLIYRLIDLQVVKHAKYAHKAQQMTQRVVLIESRRGDILDVNGNPLATSIPVKRVLANPRYVGRYYLRLAEVLAPLINYDPATLAEKLKPRILRYNSRGEPVTNAYVNLARKVTYERWKEIRERVRHFSLGAPDKALPRAERIALRALRSAAIYSTDDQQRVYPGHGLAAHVIGYVR